MTSELVIRGDDLNATMLYAERLASSGLLPTAYRANPANVLYAIEYGRMIGLAPMAAITGVHIIEGKPTASAALISALVRRAGHKLRITGNDTTATAEIIRADDPTYTFTATWTLDRAKQADLAGKGTWKKYPAAMLKARAITEAARDACEEALLGLHYTPEELGADVDADGAPVVVTVHPESTPRERDAARRLGQTPAEPVDDAIIVHEPKTYEDYLGDIMNAETRDSLENVKTQLQTANGTLTQEQKTSLNELWTARRDDINNSDPTDKDI